MGVQKLSHLPSIDEAAERRATQIRHFHGTTRTTSDWDGLRRDASLWFEKADCLVYFYAHQASQRGASLRVPYSTVKDLESPFLKSQCLRKSTRFQSASESSGQLDQGYLHLRHDRVPESQTYELYVPAPSGCTRDEILSYHLATRNVFAYALGLPLVGKRLGIALVDLWKRLIDWNISVELSTFTTYLDTQGYLDFTDSTEHSLACLQLADEGRLRSIWVESFVHCVGMRERLDLSPEYSGLNKTTAALILRASLEMDLHITRVVKAVGTFLESELGFEHVGLSRPMRDHLDHFRSFLHSFYVNRFGYFPPHMTTPWNKRPWTSMSRDFQNLYDYLADKESSADWQNNRALHGGFCVLQNIQYFDLLHRYQPLPHPMPLLPKSTVERKDSFKGLRGLNLRRSNSNQTSSSICIATETATNTLDAEAMRCPLVQEYRRFENELEYAKSKLDPAEARKVRWLLIYGVIQMLGSVVQAPAEVKDTITPSYPLCSLTAGCPPWDVDEDAQDLIYSKSMSAEKVLSTAAPNHVRKKSSEISIHPDCEADSAEEYFASQNASRENLFRGQTSALPIPSRHGSTLRSGLNTVGSLIKRHSIHRGSPPENSPRESFICQPVLENSDEAETRNIELEYSPPTDEVTPPPRSPLRDFDFGFSPQRREVIIDESLAEDRSPPCSPMESESSNSTKPSRGSHRSSATADDPVSPATAPSSWDSGSSRRNSAASDLSFTVEPLASKRPASYQPSKPLVDHAIAGRDFSLGTYTPKGMYLDPGEANHAKRPSVDTSASSDYMDESVQAADIYDSPSRGRPRSRDVNVLSHYGIVLGDGNVW